MSRSPAVDTYAAKSAEFARPILTRVRAAMHKACPQIEETIKWGVPHFEYKGVVASVAAFRRNPKAQATYDSFSPSQRREYVEWMAEGKPRNWKYINC